MMYSHPSGIGGPRKHDANRLFSLAVGALSSVQCLIK